MVSTTLLCVYIYIYIYIYIYVACLYPIIPHDEGLSALRKRLDLRQEKDVTTSTLVEVLLLWKKL